MRKLHLRRIYIISFLFSLHIAISAYVNSTYLTKILPEKYVGIIYIMASLLELLALSNTSVILKNLGNRKLTLATLAINLLSLGIIINTQNAFLIGLAFVGFLATNVLFFFCLDIFIEHFGDKEEIGRTRGAYLTISNLAWMLSPMITGALITKEKGYKAIYILAFCMTTVIALFFLFSKSYFKDRHYEKTPFLKTYKFLNTNKHIKAITMISFILNFFYAWMVVYTPIYLIGHIGLSWKEVGFVFTFMLAPFVLFGLPTGILIDKYHVRKRTLLSIGIIIASLSTISITFLNTKSLLVWAIILFLTRTGATTIETVSEIYFFTHVKEEEAGLLSIFRDMSPVGYLVGAFLGSAFLSFFPFKYIFIVLGVIVLFAFYYVPKLKHHHEEYQK